MPVEESTRFEYVNYVYITVPPPVDANFQLQVMIQPVNIGESQGPEGLDEVTQKVIDLFQESDLKHPQVNVTADRITATSTRIGPTNPGPPPPPPESE
jgi:hypothetical protein